MFCNIILYFIKCFYIFLYVFFFSSRRRHTRWPRDWSSVVCSSDLIRSFHLQQERADVHVRGADHGHRVVDGDVLGMQDRRGPVQPDLHTRLQQRRVVGARSEEHTSELQSRGHLVCRLLLEKKKTKNDSAAHYTTIW